MKERVLMLSALVGLLVATPANAAWIGEEEAIMGTRIRVELWHEDEAAGQAAVQAVMDEMHRIDRLMSTYKPDSEISRVNSDAAEHAVAVSDELLDLIELSLEMSVVTDGAFDITYASVGYMYDFRAGKKPSAEEIEAALPAVNFRHVRVDREAGEVQFVQSGVRIDLGGIAKGYAVERGVALLQERGVQHALVTAGGDTRVLGDRDGRPWRVGIRNPRGAESDVIALLPLVDEAISTSGDYERYFVEDGVIYHHIIEPGTGRSARKVRSVTIVGPDATQTDAMSTSVFVLGVEDGLRLIDELPDLEAVIVDNEGELFFSKGFEALQKD